MSREWYRRAAAVILIVLILLLYQYNKHRYFALHGVYTVGKAIGYEADDQGGTIIYEVYFNNMIFNAKIGHSNNGRIGRYNFLKISPTYPSKIGWEGEEVPECILSKPIPYEGWKELPNCE